MSDKTISNVKPLSIYNCLVPDLHIDSDEEVTGVKGVGSTPLVIETPHSTDQKVVEKKHLLVRPKIDFPTTKRENLLPRNYYSKNGGNSFSENSELLY